MRFKSNARSFAAKHWLACRLGRASFACRSFATADRSLVLLVLLSLGFSAPAMAWEASNCVDGCIVELIRHSKIQSRTKSYEQILMEHGFAVDADSRSLMECTEILRCLGVATKSSYFRGEIRTSWSIIYVNGVGPESIGHVMIVFKDDEGTLVLYDPAGDGLPRPVSFTGSTAFNGAIAISPVSYGGLLRHRSFCIALFLSLGCGALASFCLAAFRESTGVGKPFRLRFVKIFFLILPALQIGCTQSTDVAGFVPEAQIKEFDFGVMPASESDPLLTHRFVIQNDSDEALTVDSVLMSCGCLNAGESIVGKVIEPNQGLPLILHANTNGRVGFYRQQAVVRFAESTVPERVFIVKAFVERSPASMVSENVIEVRCGEVCRSYVSVARIRHSDSPELGLPRVALKAEKKLCLSIGDTSFASRLVGETAVSEEWRIPISVLCDHFELPATFPLLVSWGDGEVECSVDLILKQRPYIRFHSPDLYFPPLELGIEHTEEIPVEFLDVDSAQDLSVSSNLEGLHSEIDHVKSLVLLTFRPESEGHFTAKVEFKLGDTVLPEVLSLQGEVFPP